MQRALSSIFIGQFGVAGAVSTDAHLSGAIWDDADPQFDNYTYKYQVQHGHVAIKGKILADDGYWAMPWLSGSVGVGFNTAHHFDNTPTIFEAVKNPNFTSHTTTTFTYTVGAGLQKNLNQNWQIGVGYEFADWGKSQLGRAVGQTLNSGLKLDHLYTNGLMLTLLMLFKIY